MDSVNVSEFKATCLRLLEQVRRTGEPLEILKNGEPLAIVHAPPPRQRKHAHGSMRGTLRGDAADLIGPLDETDWEALR